MKHVKYVVCLFVWSMVWSGQGVTATNPIAWSLNQSFPSPVFTGTLNTVTYTFTNRLPLQLAKPLVIKKNASPATEFTYVDTCTGTRLLRNQSCTVQVTLSALVAGTKFVQLSIAGYDDNVVPLPELVTVANSTLTGSVVGSVTHSLPGSMDVNTNASYTFKFQNNSDTDANGLHVTVTQTTGTVHSTNTCTDPLTKNGGVCYVTGEFMPTSNSPEGQVVLASLAYTGPTGSPSTIYTSTKLNGGVPGGPIVGSVAVGATLPPLMTPGQVVSGTPGGVEFLFTNTSSDTTYYFTTPTVVLTWSDNDGGSGSCPSTLSATTPACAITQNNCIASLSASPAACSVYSNFTAPTGAASNPPLTYTLEATLSYSASESGPFSEIATAETSATVIATIPTERTIKVVNNCNFPLTYSLNGASTPCGTGANPDSTGACFWINYHGSNPNNVLAANTGTDYITIPANDIGGIQWSGNLSAMIGCNSSGTDCTQAKCNDTGVGNCAIGRGFNQPATQAEFTLLTNSADNYNGEVINGFHIPISMQPYYYINPSDSADDIPATPSNFSCGTPGNFNATIETTGFGSCNWDTASVPSTPTPNYYYKVGGGSQVSCASASCTDTHEVCGLSQVVPNSTISEPVCGNFEGYWTPNQLCTQQTNLPADVIAGLGCAAPLPADFNLATDPYNNTHTSLMACHVAKGYTGPIYASCYTPAYTPPGSSTQCCGCVDWWEPSQTGEVILANTTSQTCPITPTVHIDPEWLSNVKGGIQWLKKACPSIYVYPFDDTTSKFTCTNSTQSGTNSTSYVITFCPGNSGLPSGKTEGRGVV